MTRRHDDAPPWWFALLVLALLLLVLCGIHACTQQQCEQRGGHVEIVWGGKGGWTCDT